MGVGGGGDSELEAKGKVVVVPPRTICSLHQGNAGEVRLAWGESSPLKNL